MEHWPAFNPLRWRHSEAFGFEGDTFSDGDSFTDGVECRQEAQICPAELSTGLVAARRVHMAERTYTLLLSRFLSVMVGWVAPSVHVAESYRSGGQGVARTLPELRLCLYARLIIIML